jgi:hypothetical protein
MNVDGVDSDSEIDEAITDTPPDIADEASKTFSLYLVIFFLLPKKNNVHLGQKVPFVLACFQVSAPPRLKTQTRTKNIHFFVLIHK